MTKQVRDIATVFGDAYSKSCPKVLGDQHSFLLETLESFLSEKQNPTLVVVGPGGQVLPYSCQYTEKGELGDSNRTRIKEIMRDGKLILVDYVDSFEDNGLVKGLNTLIQMGFFEKEFFNVGSFELNGTLDPNNLEAKTISFLKNNLRDPLRISENSVDAMDANLSIHHASVSKDELERVYSEIYRVLKPNGLLHLGEGNVDMNYSEEKLIRIGQDISSLLNQNVYISDEREKNTGYVINSFFQLGKKYDRIPVVDKDSLSSKDYASVRITEDGLVIIKSDQFLEPDKSKEISDKLRELAYKNMFTFRDIISLPLIDPEMKEDAEGQIIPVNQYYDAIKAKVIKGYSGVDNRLVEGILEGSTTERGLALRGLVEYYMGEKTILKALENVGFKDIEVTHHEVEPFYNITARKPDFISD